MKLDYIAFNLGFFITLLDALVISLRHFHHSILVKNLRHLIRLISGLPVLFLSSFGYRYCFLFLFFFILLFFFVFFYFFLFLLFFCFVCIYCVEYVI